MRPWYRDAEHFARHVERRRREWAVFETRLAGEEPFAFRDVYVHTLAALPGLWEHGLGERVTSMTRPIQIRALTALVACDQCGHDGDQVGRRGSQETISSPYLIRLT